MNRYPSVKKHVKVPLYLSHDNADVERGFLSRKILTDGKCSMSHRLINDRLYHQKCMFKNASQILIIRNLKLFAHKSYDVFIKEQK